jgi:hypothetical protein
MPHVAIAALAFLVNVALASATPPAAVTFLPIPDRRDVVFDSTSSTLFVSTGAGIERYSVTTGAFLPRFNLNAGLLAIDLSPDRRTLVLTDYDSGPTTNWVHTVDTATGVSSRITFNKSFNEGGTYAAAYNADGTLLVTSQYNGSGWVPLRRHFPATGTTTTVANVRQDSMLAPSFDRSTVFIAESNISSGQLDRFDVATSTFRPIGGTGWFNFEIAANRDGTQITVPSYNGAFVLDRNAQPLGLIGQYATEGPIGAVYSPVDNLLYTAWWSSDTASDQIRVFNANNLDLLATYNVGGRFDWTGNSSFAEGRMKISDDGNRIFVTVDGGVSILTVPAPAAGPLLFAAAGFASRRRRSKPTHG